MRLDSPRHSATLPGSYAVWAGERQCNFATFHVRSSFSGRNGLHQRLEAQSENRFSFSMTSMLEPFCHP